VKAGAGKAGFGMMEIAGVHHQKQQALALAGAVEASEDLVNGVAIWAVFATD